MSPEPLNPISPEPLNKKKNASWKGASPQELSLGCLAFRASGAELLRSFIGPQKAHKQKIRIGISHINARIMKSNKVGISR